MVESQKNHAGPPLQPEIQKWAADHARTWQRLQSSPVYDDRDHQIDPGSSTVLADADDGPDED